MLGPHPITVRLPHYTSFKTGDPPVLEGRRFALGCDGWSVLVYWRVACYFFGSPLLAFAITRNRFGTRVSNKADAKVGCLTRWGDNDDDDDDQRNNVPVCSFVRVSA